METSSSVARNTMVCAAGLAAVAVHTGTAFLGPLTPTVQPGNQDAAPLIATSLQTQAQPAATPAPHKTALGAVALAASAAFVARSARRGKVQSAKPQLVSMKAFESELGVQAPVGFWDPLGFTADGDEAAFKRRRSVELKHGRISMLATMGYITPEITGKFPGYLSPSAGLKFADIPNGLAAISKVPSLGWVQIILYMGYCEFSGGFDDYKTGTPGDYGFKVLTSSDPEEKTKKLSAEIANGRLAMMAIIGMFFQDGLTGSAWGDWALYTDSPLRAFEGELGVQAPVGFFDPLGLSKDGDVATFKRRRESEIKHGRISMLATMGYITPALTGKFPGYLSPSLGIKYADIPNGLGAISKVPAFGWFQILAYALYCEASSDAVTWRLAPPGTETASEPGNRGFKPPLLATDDVETRKRRLNAELANGRLAMMAIIGMFFQDGLTGSAWGDWANYTDSPLRAFEGELGVQAPVGFFDPLGLSKDGDIATFKRRRESEIKHGRISMLATMGYITPELTGKFPGYLSPSLGIKYADIPNGLGAISKVPVFGWFQILAYALYCESSSDAVTWRLAPPGTETTSEPGNRGYKPPLLATDDVETRKRRLNSELANGRLAMMAIIGMFFQDGLTGSAWGDWANYTDSPLRAFEGELGVQAPVGFFDPLGLSKDGDVATFKRRRESEIKHGRISMLATMGYITPELTGKFPGYLSPSLGIKYADIPNGLGAISKVPAFGWLQILAYALYCEASSDAVTWRLAPAGTEAASEPGNRGFKPPLLATDDAETRKRRLNAELANGRLAMMAIIGMFFQDGLTGSAWGDWANYTDSPLRAFEGELGVQAPVGFFDPLGLSKDGDIATFKRRRESEIKHGRISMLATMGYITPELTGKFPGYLSPSLGVKYADIPNGLGAISKVPAFGWFQILAYALYCEASSDAVTWRLAPAGTEAASEPGNRGFKPPLLATDDAETRKRRLNAELANGRLAMMAIIGMFFQDGLTGSAWGDWAAYTDSPLRAFESELGVQAPVGFFDPFGLTKDGDVEAFKRRRATELKNGRVAMLACMGYIAPEAGPHFPGYLAPSLELKFSDVPNGLAALSKVPGAGWTQIFLFIGLIEKGFLVHDPSRAPGDFEKGGILGVPNGSRMADGPARTRKLQSELANGRLAMMAITGMFFQDGLTGSAWGDWSLYTDSPLRAFENELGVQPPVGFWDPLGLSKSGDVDEFKRRRESELKHGRISMFATMGYMTAEYFRFPGELSPSTGLAFKDVPNGLAAISKVPPLGWVQWFLFCGLVDYGLYRADPSRDPGDFENGGILGVPNASGPMMDAEGRKRKLNAELANGRLAMVAIMGMLFQDGTVGSAGPAMWGF